MNIGSITHITCDSRMLSNFVWQPVIKVEARGTDATEVADGVTSEDMNAMLEQAVQRRHDSEAILAEARAKTRHRSPSSGHVDTIHYELLVH